jgi:hypothetical protein
MRRLAFLLPAILLLSVPSRGQTGELAGSLKSLDSYHHSSPSSGIEAGWFSANRLRLEGTQQTPGLRLDAAVEALWLLSDPAGVPPLPGANPNRRIDLEHDFARGQPSAGQVLIDRLQVQFQTPGLEWNLGRQPVGFGRIVLFSPLDVVAPFAPDALDTDVRPGVDALRAVHYFGSGGQFGGNLVVDREGRDNSCLATFSDNRSGIDLLAIAGQLRGRPMAGFGLAGSLGGLGLKGEVAVYRGTRVGQPGGDRYEQFAIGAVEGWLRFENDLVLLGQYLYNGPGASDPAEYLQAALSAPFLEGMTYLTGRHYLLLAPSYELHPLVNLQGLLICNLGDDSFLFRPLLDISLADNLDLQLFWAFNFGRKPLSTPLPPLPRSEFGSRAASGGIFVSWYF